MSSPRTPGFLPNKHWPGIIDRLLDGTPTEQAESRETLWVEVERYVVHFARPPIGPLADDPDVRSQLALKVLRRIEQNDFRHLRLWREKQRHRQDSSAWWGWISTMTRRLAIDVARGSKQNLARRGEPFRWARVVPVNPAVFDEAHREALGQSIDFLEQASEEDVATYLAALQGMLRGGLEHEDGDDGELTAESPPATVKRGEDGENDENGENGDGGGAR